MPEKLIVAGLVKKLPRFFLVPEELLPYLAYKSKSLIRIYGKVFQSFYFPTEKYSFLCAFQRAMWRANLFYVFT
jgi:hypothetical protein